MKRFILSVLAGAAVFAVISCEKDFGRGLYFKSIYQDYFYGDGREHLEYPGRLINTQAELDKVSRDIDAINSISDRLRSEPLDFEHYTYVLLVDSIRRIPMAINMVYADVVNRNLKIYYRTVEKPDTPHVAVTQAFQFIKLDRGAFDEVNFIRTK